MTPGTMGMRELTTVWRYSRCMIALNKRTPNGSIGLNLVLGEKTAGVHRVACICWALFSQD